MQNPTKFIVDIKALREIASSFVDDKDLGSFFRKAVDDLEDGCVKNDVDSRVITLFNKATNKLNSSQAKNEKYYNNKKGFGEPGSAACQNSNTISQQVAEPNLFPDVSCKKSFGEYGLVKLTAAQEAKRRAYYGDDFDKAVKFLENYIMSLPSKVAKEKKNGAKYWQEEYAAKDHYKILDEGNWVDKKIKLTKLLDKRLENASRGHKSFAEIDREARVRMIRGQSVNHESKVNDNCLTIEQLKELYG